MEKRSVVAVVLGVVSVACATGALESGAPPPPTPFLEPLATEGDRSQVTGVVVDHKKGNGIAGALVIVQCTCLQGARELMTIDGGAYSFRDLPPGKYTVQVLYRDANVSKTFELPAKSRVRANFRIDPERRFDITIT